MKIDESLKSYTARDYVIDGRRGHLQVHDRRHQPSFLQRGAIVKYAVSVEWMPDGAALPLYSCDWNTLTKAFEWFERATDATPLSRWSPSHAEQLPPEFVSIALLMMPDNL